VAQNSPQGVTQGKSCYGNQYKHIVADGGSQPRCITEHAGQSLARLSSGSKIVSPEDDAAGLAVSLRFDAQIKRTSAASANVSNAIPSIKPKTVS